VSSGTEATMSAIRLARAYTKRKYIVKFEGCYHGHSDSLLVKAGSGVATLGIPGSAGVPEEFIQFTLALPFNNVNAVEYAFQKFKHQIACVIVEPIVGNMGCVPAADDYLVALRLITERENCVLIFDEVITLRLAFGGAQQIYAVRPDLTTLGKIIGGGLPVGAFGGRADIMSLFNPARGRLPHSGTFNGNPATVAAGIAALELLTEDAIALTNQLGDRLRTGLQGVIQTTEIDAQLTGVGSLVGIHFTREPIRNYRDALRAPRNMLSVLHLSLLNRGMFIAPRGFLCTSTVMSESEVDELVGAFEDTLLALKQETYA